MAVITGGVEIQKVATLKYFLNLLIRSRLIDVFDNWMVGDQINWNRVDDLIGGGSYQMNHARLLVDRKAHSKDAEYLRGTRPIGSASRSGTAQEYGHV